MFTDIIVDIKGYGLIMSKTNLSKKVFSGLVISALAVLTLAGCSSSSYDTNKEYELSFTSSYPVGEVGAALGLITRNNDDLIIERMFSEAKSTVIADYASAKVVDGEVNVSIDIPVKFNRTNYGGDTVISPSLPFNLGDKGASFVSSSTGEQVMLRNYLPAEVFMNKEGNVTVVVFVDELFGEIIAAGNDSNLGFSLSFPGEVVDSSVGTVDGNTVSWGNDMVVSAATKTEDGALSATWSN